MNNQHTPETLPDACEYCGGHGNNVQPCRLPNGYLIALCADCREDLNATEVTK